jgi:vacuolar-type H+-ATPase subunit H
MEAIRTITELEDKSRAERSEAEARVKQALAEAEHEGQTQLKKARREAAEHGREMLRNAEARAAKAAEEVAKRAEAESDALRASAKGRLNEAADMIVGRVVKS